MTEYSYQVCRKLMQHINYVRWQITQAKGHVAQWTKIQSTYLSQGQEGRAAGAKKALDKALERLEAARAKLAGIKFPESDLQEPVKEVRRCEECKAILPVYWGSYYCKACSSR